MNQLMKTKKMLLFATAFKCLYINPVFLMNYVKKNIINITGLDTDVITDVITLFF